MQAEAALRQAEIVRWLASNPAQRTDAPGRDPSVLLHRLQLGQASAPPSAGRQVPHPCPSHTRVCCCSHGHCSCVPGGRGAPGTTPQAGLLRVTHGWHHSWADRKHATCMLGGPDTCGAGESVVVSAVVSLGISDAAYVVYACSKNVIAATGFAKHPTAGLDTCRAGISIVV